MEKVKILVHKKFQKNRIDPRIYGSFVEHMGRVVYSGIYEPSHPSADENGFRRDVMEKAREMGITAVRYPGGNFVSNYNWMDGIGPKEKRPRRLELAWKSVETNEVGTDEFMKWADTMEISPVFAVNLGTRGIESAVSLLEYCNHPGGTYYSDLRRKNGREEPYGIRTWCLGNEMDGDWQIGHKTAKEYGRLAYETGKAMKIVDPSIELVVCGSSMSTNATFGEWEQTVLSHTYECADYISLHQYYGGQEKGTEAFLAQSLDMERYIRTVCGICDVEMARRRSRKQLNICFDEWGVWAVSDKEVQKYVEEHPWQIAPPVSEQIYTMEDALLFASMLMNLIRYSGRIRIACQSLLANVSACIMTERGGGVWLQPTYYPFAMMAKYGKGIVMEDRFEGPVYQTESFQEVPKVDHVTVYHPEKKELVLFLVNRSETQTEVEVELQMFHPAQVTEASGLWHRDKKAVNKENHENVIPRELSDYRLSGDRLTCRMEPLSFLMLRISLDETSLCN